MLYLKEQRVTSALREARLARGLSTYEVAKLTYYSYQTIQRAELGTLYRGKKADVRRRQFWETMSELYGKPIEELQEVSE